MVSLPHVVNGLKLAHEIIDAGWIKGTFFKDGCYCAEGALKKAFGGDENTVSIYIDDHDNLMQYLEAAIRLEEEIEREGFYSIASFNDAQKDKQKVLDVFSKIIQDIENEMNESRNEG